MIAGFFFATHSCIWVVHSHLFSTPCSSERVLPSSLPGIRLDASNKAIQTSSVRRPPDALLQTLATSNIVETACSDGACKIRSTRTTLSNKLTSISMGGLLTFLAHVKSNLVTDIVALGEHGGRIPRWCRMTDLASGLATLHLCL